MKILVSWLRDFVDVPVGVEELAWALHLRGFELAGIEPPPAGVGAGAPDGVLDLEITTNRPDCLSILGIAREVAATYDRPLRRPPAHASSPAAPGASLQVVVDEAGLCPRYAASVAEVEVGPSPTWLAARLEALGVRPINNVVDVSNYVMLELGHPMHAFDLEKLAGRTLRIRRARAGEPLRTLDGVGRTLAADMLVIADADRAQAVAGVMGGADSEVDGRTRTVAFESAYFDPPSVRRTSRRLALSTDASYRFERGADIGAPVVALERALALLAQIGAGRPVGGIVDRYPSPRAPRSLQLRHGRIGRVLGQQIDPTFVEKTLTNLGFALTADDARAWNVVVPTGRVDVGREIDLIEEVARHYGYDRLPTVFPAATAPAARPGPWYERNQLVRRVLTAAGFSEAITYGFIERAAALAFHADERDVVAIANPLSEKFAVLRPSLLPGLVDSIIRNRRRERRDVRLFELGTSFRASRGERAEVAIGWTGAGAPAHWSHGERMADFFDIKGVVERVSDAFGVALRFEPAHRPDLVAGRTAAIHAVEASAPPIGFVGQLRPSLAAERGLPGASDEIYVAAIDLHELDRLARRRDDVQAAPLPRHPSIVRDLSIVVDDILPAATVRGTIQAAAGPALTSVGEFDRYQGEGVEAGRVSLSFRLTFRAADRTLTDAEVQHAIDEVVRALERSHQARLR